MSEDRLQMAVNRYLSLLGLVWCHVPNEGARNPVAGRRAKEKGLKAGVPDCLIFNPSMIGPTGVAIELKVGKNKLTETQHDWRNKLLACNWAYYVAHSFDDVQAIVKENYNL